MTNSLTTIQPTQIELVAPKAELNFFDQQSVELETPMTPLQVWTFLMKNPLPMIGFAFKVRDAISKWFGVKEIGGFSGHIPGFLLGRDSKRHRPDALRSRPPSGYCHLRHDVRRVADHHVIGQSA